MSDNAPRNRYDLAELGGAFGDLGTLIPFVVAYVAVLKMDPTGILLAFGAALVEQPVLAGAPGAIRPG